MLLLWATTPINAGFIENYFLEILACVHTLAVLANLLNQEEDEDIQYILHKKFICSSLAIIVAAEAAYRDLLHTTAAVQKHKVMQKDAQQSLQTGGVLYVQNRRNTVKNSKLLILQNAQKKLKKLKKRAANKVIKAQKYKEIDTRKVIKAYNKANRIVVRRGPYKMKQ